MNQQRAVRLLHLCSTVWFILCIGYIMLSAFRQAGVRWWVIFSLSGYSALFVFLLISLYLFAIFRGVDRSQKLEIEHPLTVTNYYMVFYVAAPFLGGVAGCLGMIGVRTVGQFLSGVALGTLGTTFLVWVIVDPVAGLLEMLLPGSRRHRATRLARARILRERRQQRRKLLLANVLAQAEQNQQRWQRALQPYAEKLALLLTTDETDFQRAEREATDLGVNAWQLGGLSCMRQLRDMAIATCRKNRQDSTITDYISSWWDGIGSWRNTSLG
ncbi:MAG TPA: hypothetical protein VMW16_08220 [Sedimentisphaerales bacterium]|nr:hypothetical protein [Sedimentisphaerales bacterium]